MCLLMSGRLRGGCLVLFLSAASLLRVQATPTITSMVPANNSANVPVNSTIVFTFSEAMDTRLTIWSLGHPAVTSSRARARRQAAGTK